ncbi:hypothetical protein [Leifsonia sp. NPDC077715]|uniref:hypothetical protein n=1 Tax=Leifsonia sp. NPDC077715 TaxID=3155539 RepID=UPI0034169DF2
MELVEALRIQLDRQVSHWEAASVALRDPSSFSADGAWKNLERYLDRAVRASLEQSTQSLHREIQGLRTQLDGARLGPQLVVVARRLQRVRRRYGQVETVVSFYADAVNTRTNPTLGTHMRALDRIAVTSMRSVLDPMGQQVPPVLTYVDKGLGAAILRAGVRLWDGRRSPAAAIKVTRHNLYRPTALVHETGHQVAHLLGWNREASAAMGAVLADDPELSRHWRSWTSEITADAYAFVHCGYAAVAALHDVVANEIESVLQLVPGDPHPVSYIRVLLGVEMCRRAYGAGPWDDLAAAWKATHPLARAVPSVGDVLARSTARLPELVDALLSRPCEAFGARSLTTMVDPQRVAPAELEKLAAASGPSLFTSSYLVDREQLRIVALTGLRIAVDPRNTIAHTRDFARFAQTLGVETTTALAA